ncbi:hypothetical protein V3C99_018317, partial [Haemonchus contortus]
EVSTAMHHDASPHHNTSTTRTVPLNNVSGSVACSHLCAI